MWGFVLLVFFNHTSSITGMLILLYIHSDHLSLWLQLTEFGVLPGGAFSIFLVSDLNFVGLRGSPCCGSISGVFGTSESISVFCLVWSHVS